MSFSVRRRRGSSVGRTARSGGKSVLRTWALRLLDFLHSGGALICALPLLWELDASCSARQSVHILEILRTGNLAPGNAGVILYTDILVPLIGFTLLYLQHRYSPTGSKKRSPIGCDR